VLSCVTRHSQRLINIKSLTNQAILSARSDLTSATGAKLLS